MYNNTLKTRKHMYTKKLNAGQSLIYTRQGIVIMACVHHCIVQHGKEYLSSI